VTVDIVAIPGGHIEEMVVQPHNSKSWDLARGEGCPVRTGHESGRPLEEVPTVRFTMNSRRWQKIGATAPTPVN
jgi:hypothetical protein